jgi:hypothetical protein
VGHCIRAFVEELEYLMFCPSSCLIARIYICQHFCDFSAPLSITANQPFSQWDSIFSDSMMTVAAVDRLVHHALILDIKSDSYRRHAASAHSQAT